MIRVDVSVLQEKIQKTRWLLENSRVHALGLAYYFLNVIRERTPKRSGDTRASWKIHWYRSGDQVTWEISPDGHEKEVMYLEFGTKPHVIYPAHSTFKMPHGVLVFEKDGEKIFAMSVYHPSTKPLGFVRLTQDDLDKSINDMVDKLHSSISSTWG